MKRIFAVLFLLTQVALVASAEPSAREEPLTLTDALSQALNSSPRLEEARSAVLQARGKKRGARAEGKASLELEASQTAQGPAARGVRHSRQSEAALRLSVPIDANGQIRAEKRAAGYGERAALAWLDAESQRLVLDVTEAYLDAAQARQEIILVGELKRLNEERLRVARVRLEAGVAQPLEVSQTEADLADAVQREIDAQARARQMAASLNVLIGRPAAAPLVLMEGDLSDEKSLPRLQAETPEMARALAPERPDLRALRAEVARARAGEASARASRRPLATLGGNLVERAPATFLGGWAWSLGTSLVQSLFDGGRSRARLEQARAERARTGAVLSQAERNADAQVERSLVALAAAEKRLGAEDRRVLAADEGVVVARRRQEAGLAPAVEVTEAETILTRGRTDALTARFEVARARVRLAYAAGVAQPG